MCVMDLTYTLRTADGREYGPVTQVQIVAWAHEGRVAANSELRRSDMQHWAAARDFEEFKFLFASETEMPPVTPGIIAPPPGAAQDATLVSQMKSGASWFYWIAALSLINSVIALTGEEFRFIFGLGITQITDSFGAEAGGIGKAMLFATNLLIVGILAAFGYFGCKRHLWAFFVGMGLYLLDAILLLFFQSWLEVAFHAFVIYCLFRGLQACRALRSN
jgi:hypothetical protein